jgi:tripartite-type tricarboxylate transporter receptor subunit TctC
MHFLARALAALAAGCVVLSAPSIVTARAPDYPMREITMIVPFAAGGPTDTIARTIVGKMSQVLGQPIRIENVIGAGGTTGTAGVAHAPNDGYTLIVGHMGTHAAAVPLYPSLSYHPERDFEPVSVVAATPIVIVARKELPPRTLRDFIAYARTNTDRINMAHAGVGSASYASCELLNRLLGIRPTGVPFGGAAPALAAVANGQVDHICDQMVNVVPQVMAGAVKAYAVASPDRSPALPDVPTTVETGLPAFQIQVWNAVFVPKGTPARIVARINEAISAALDDVGVRSQLQARGSMIPLPSERGPKVLAALVKSEIARWTPILRTAAK